jgi:nucleoside-diphosphate-sugar epimerase
MKSALIGYTGFVGSNLQRQTSFSDCYRSTTIDHMRGKHFDLVVCAGVSAAKWLANRDPENDVKAIERLTNVLETITTELFVLISTVDIYGNVKDVDESSEVFRAPNNHYGNHRYQLEKFVTEKYPSSMVVRLPGLFGSGLKKNIIYDFIHNNEIEKIDSRSRFQFYNIDYLWTDILRARSNSIPLLNITSEPLSVQELALHCFNKEFSHTLAHSPADYNIRSRWADLWAGKNGYLYTKDKVLFDLAKYVSSSRGS